MAREYAHAYIIEGRRVKGMIESEALQRYNLVLIRLVWTCVWEAALPV